MAYLLLKQRSRGNTATDQAKGDHPDLKNVTSPVDGFFSGPLQLPLDYNIAGARAAKPLLQIG